MRYAKHRACYFIFCVYFVLLFFVVFSFARSALLLMTRFLVAFSAQSRNAFVRMFFFLYCLYFLLCFGFSFGWVMIWWGYIWFYKLFTKEGNRIKLTPHCGSKLRGNTSKYFFAKSIGWPLRKLMLVHLFINLVTFLKRWIASRSLKP